MSDARERAVEAVLRHRGLAGLFASDSVRAEIAAIEAAGLRIVDADRSDGGPFLHEYETEWGSAASRDES